MVRAIKNFAAEKRQQSYWGKIEKECGGKIQGVIGNGEKHCGDYMITPAHHLRFIEKHLRKVGITEEDAVFDIGCGWGGMLLYFSQYPFKKVRGLECSQEIADTGLENLAIWGIDAQIVIGNAVSFDDYDEYNYFYLANPFDDVIMRGFLKNLGNSMRRRPRQVTVLYVNCLHKDVFVEDGFKVESYFKRNMFHAAESIVLRKSV